MGWALWDPVGACTQTYSLGRSGYVSVRNADETERGGEESEDGGGWCGDHEHVSEFKRVEFRLHMSVS